MSSLKNKFMPKNHRRTQQRYFLVETNNITFNNASNFGYTNLLISNQSL